MSQINWEMQTIENIYYIVRKEDDAIHVDTLLLASLKTQVKL